MQWPIKCLVLQGDTLQPLLLSSVPLYLPFTMALARDIPIIEEFFARAFNADPFLNWYVLPGKRRKERIIRSFDILIREIAMGHDQIFTTTDSIKGGAVWVPSGKWEMCILRQLSLRRLTPRITGLSCLFTRILGLLMIEGKHAKVDH